MRGTRRIQRVLHATVLSSEIKSTQKAALQKLQRSSRRLGSIFSRRGIYYSLFYDLLFGRHAALQPSQARRGELRVLDAILSPFRVFPFLSRPGTMKSKARIGTSGFGIARAKYVQLFSCVEVQHTFYQPPKISTLERWRENAAPDFEFVLKAWQLITHDAKSPTYRRLKKKLSECEKQEAGYFRSTSIVKEAWDVTLACANALKARTILFQCPASFKQTAENISNLEGFFGNLNRQRKPDEQFNFCWEPRGDWDRRVVKRICDDLNLWHAVDPFTAKSVTPDKLYFRLHGRNGWRYEYEEGESRELAAMLPKHSAKTKTPYVFFNNARMTQDALRFQAITEETQQRLNKTLSRRLNSLS